MRVEIKILSGAEDFDGLRAQNLPALTARDSFPAMNLSSLVFEMNPPAPMTLPPAKRFSCAASTGWATR